MSNEHFFEGGHLPPEFNGAAEGQSKEPKRPADPHLRYNPPRPVPGLELGSTPEINDIAKEELDSNTRDAIEQAQKRMDHGENEMGDSITPEFQERSWESEEIEAMRKEDESRGPRQPDWDDQAQHEYERWEMEESRARYEDRWGDRDAIDHAEEYFRNSFDRPAEGLDLDTGFDGPAPDHGPDIEH